MQAITMNMRERMQLESKMRKVFQNEMKRLSDDLQSILADDLVTAFLNRISVFLKIEAKKRQYTATKRILDP